jgi:hypothetical protein
MNAEPSPRLMLPSNAKRRPRRKWYQDSSIKISVRPKQPLQYAMRDTQCAGRLRGIVVMWMRYNYAFSASTRWEECGLSTRTWSALV